MDIRTSPASCCATALQFTTWIIYIGCNFWCVVLRFVKSRFRYILWGHFIVMLKKCNYVRKICFKWLRWWVNVSECLWVRAWISDIFIYWFFYLLSASEWASLGSKFKLKMCSHNIKGHINAGYKYFTMINDSKPYVYSAVFGMKVISFAACFMR